MVVREDISQIQEAEIRKRLGLSGDLLQFKDPSKPVEKSNQWILEKTNGQIPNLVDEIDPKTLMVLLSATVFKGQWIYQFKSSDTKINPFTNLDGVCVNVPFMFLESDELRYAGKRWDK
ncbi:MAG: hypothetical protein Tsb0021_01330 [Chlamydiales bacterium]